MKVIFNNIYKYEELYNKVLILIDFSYDVLEGEEKELVNFCKNYYNANKKFPSRDVLLNNFSLIDKNLSKDELANYIDSKFVFYRDLKVHRKILNLVSIANKSDGYYDKVLLMDEINSILSLLNVSGDVEKNLKRLDMINVYDLYEKRKQLRGSFKTGISELDIKMGGGFSRGKLAFIIAPPKCFKTSFLLNMAYLNMRDLENENVLFITLELSYDELLYRFLIRYGYDNNIVLDIKSVLKGEADSDIIKTLEVGFKKSMKSQLYFLESGDVELISIEMFKKQLEDFIVKYNIKIVYVDYLQLFKLYAKGDLYEFQNLIVGLFRYLAVVYNVTFVVASQINKKGIERGIKTKGRFEVIDSAESNAILRDCSYLISLFANDEMKKVNKLSYQLLFHRDGESQYEPSFTFIEPAFYVLGNDINLNLNLTYVNKDIDGENINLKELFSV